MFNPPRFFPPVPGAPKPSGFPERHFLLELISDARPVMTQTELETLNLGSFGYHVQLSYLLPEHFSASPRPSPPQPGPG